MIIEQNQPPAQPQPATPVAGQAEGQAHRRRRRRRKNYPNSQSKTRGNAEPNGQSALPGRAKPAMKAPPADAARFSRKPAQIPGQTPGQISGQIQGKNGAGAGRRKGKPRRPQTFVGPMDHSYRAVNGNLTDGAPSTVEFRGNGQSGYHAEQAHHEPPAAPIREDAPVRIYCFIEDLFFLAKIQETAKKVGVKVGFLKADKNIVTRLTEVPEVDRPSLIVFDLNNVSAKPLTLIPRLKSKLKRGTSVIGFLSHLQGDLKAKAVEAGCDMVMPRSAFSQNLPNLLRRHGLVEPLEAIEVSGSA